MPQELKLTTAGQSVAMVVQSCALAKRGKYPGFIFTGDANGSVVSVEVPKQSTERQLGRLQVTPESLVGQVVTLCREENKNDPAKPWWGIYLAAGGNPNGPPGTPPASTSVAMPKPGPIAAALTPQKSAEDVRREKKEASAAIVKKYLAVFDHVAEHHTQLAAKLAEQGVDFAWDAASVNSATAAICISLDKKGLL